IRDEPDEAPAFRAAVQRADWALIIAPEFNNILLTRCRWVEESPTIREGSKCRVLGPSSAAVELCADKLALFEHWRARGVPTQETLPASSATPPWPDWVLKPRFGAGSQDAERNDTPRERGAFGPMIVQQFCPGRAASAAFLCGPKDRIALPPAAQILSDDG